MRMLDLFSGIGGFSLAGQWAAIETVQFVERDSFCQKVLAKNFPNIPIHDDIKTFSYKQPVDLITAGFPCQPFSVAGRQKGKDDDRYLWPELLRVIRETRPAWFIGENVPGIIPMLDPILEDLENEGYEWRAFLIPASATGAPHKRERLWIVAHAMRDRCNPGTDYPSRTRIQADWQQHNQALQAEWLELQPKSWATFNFQDWLGISRLTTQPHSQQCDKESADQEAITQRPEWPHDIGKAGSFCHAIHSNSLPSMETNSEASTADESRKTREIIPREYGKAVPQFNWQEDEPPFPGVDDGLPFIVDRNRALGNSIVPQVIYPIMKMIKLISEEI